MNLKEWAASQGLACVTARRLYAVGTLPVPTYRLGRLIMVGEPPAPSAPSAPSGWTVVLTSLCARRYVRRVAANRAAHTVAAMMVGPS